MDMNGLTEHRSYLFKIEIPDEREMFAVAVEVK